MSVDSFQIKSLFWFHIQNLERISADFENYPHWSLDIYSPYVSLLTFA